MKFDKKLFADHLTNNALPPYGSGKCARYVRQAMVAAGLVTTGNPLSAKDYGPFLLKLGFKSVATTLPYVPQQGDIAVMPANKASIDGHIAGYVGPKWISDFVQNDMFGGPKFREAKKFEAFRYSPSVTPTGAVKTNLSSRLA